MSCGVAIFVCNSLNLIDEQCNWKLCFDDLAPRLQYNSLMLSVNALYNSPSNLFASLIEDSEDWLDSINTEMPFHIDHDTNVDVL